MSLLRPTHHCATCGADIRPRRDAGGSWTSAAITASVVLALVTATGQPVLLLLGAIPIGIVVHILMHPRRACPRCFAPDPVPLPPGPRRGTSATRTPAAAGTTARATAR